MFDWLIKNAQILDGSGAEAFSGDVALSGGAIAAVGALSDAPAVHTLNARGRMLTPGFLDIHRHGDAALFRPDFGEAELFQGLTTILNGNCGLSAPPASGPHAPELLRYLDPIVGVMPAGRGFPDMASYFRQAAELPLRLNVGSLVGCGSLRVDAAGFSDEPLTKDQLRALHRSMEHALEDGALGVSLGLGYAPECYETTGQLLEILAPLQGSGTVVTVHMRQEGDGVRDALAEMLSVARSLRTPVEISHLKAIGIRSRRSAVPEMLKLIAQAREEGADVSCDVYPYSAGSTQLIHVLPPEAQAGGPDVLAARLRDPAMRAAIRRRMETGTDFENITLLCGFENVLACGLRRTENQRFERRSLAEIADGLDKNPYDALFDLLAQESCDVGMIDFITDEADIADILRAPFSCVISDATYPSAGLPHPRVYGTTARLLEHFVREKRILTLPEAVSRLTRRPADRFGLVGKGRLEPGADADLCLFDPAQIRESGSYADPARFAQGMDFVFVGGIPAVADGALTGAANGKVLRRRRAD